MARRFDRHGRLDVARFELHYYFLLPPNAL